jgi:hypothetical protein
VVGLARWRSAAPDPEPPWLRTFVADDWREPEDALLTVAGAEDFIAVSRHCRARNAWLAEHPAAAQLVMADLLDELVAWRGEYGPLA